MNGRTIEMRASQRVRAAVRLALSLSTLSATLTPALAAAADEDQLPEIVVTAQFRQQNLQDTPLAITAVSGELLESRNQTNITEITSQAPNVTLRRQGAAYGPSIAATIRGVGQFDFNPALEPGVGLYVDDVYYATLTGSVLDLLDLERVEILRGPQGTLAGRNSIGGAVKLYSQKPKGDDSGSLAVTYGSRDRTDVRGTADFAIADNLFVRLAGVSKQQDGYIEMRDYGCDFPNNPYGIARLRSSVQSCVIDRLSNVNYTGLRGALRWVASDSLDINLAVDVSDDNSNPTGAVLVDARTLPNENIQPITDAIPGNNAPLSAFITPSGSYRNYASYYSPRGIYNGTVVQNYPLQETRVKPNQLFKGWGASLDIDWKLAEKMSLRSISAYREYQSGFSNDNDLSPLASSLGFGALPFHSFSQEVRLNGEFADMFDYTVGAFYMNQSSRYESWQDLRYLPTNPLQFNQNDVVNADSKAGFAQLGYKATDALTVTGGVRYTKEHKDYTFVRVTRDGAAHPFLGALNGVSSDYNGSKVDYRVAAQYRWNESLMTYVQVATGMKGGGISPRPFVPQQARPFNPETLTSYEAGVKSDLIDRTLRLNASVFLSKYEDMQLNMLACPQFGGPGPCGVIANTGDADVKGGELEVTYQPIERLSIDASYSYLNFDFTFIDPAVGGPTRPTAVQYGMRPPYMPENKWSAGIQYEMALGDAGTLTPRVDYNYQSDLFTNANNRPTNHIDSYSLVNARLIWKDSAGKWESALEVTNVTDEYYFLTRFDQLAAVGHTDGQPGRPREWGLTVKRKFR